MGGGGGSGKPNVKERRKSDGGYPTASALLQWPITRVDVSGRFQSFSIAATTLQLAYSVK